MSKEIIKKKLQESISAPKRLAIFDFDGTLVDTPLKEPGALVYAKKTGVDWPHPGWWGRPESLDMDMFDMPIIYETVYAYNQEKQNPNTVMIMMTGRMSKLASQVKKILDHYNLKFDEYLYNTGGDTLGVKIRYLDKLVQKYPSAESIVMFEDRIKHVDAFKQWGKAQHLNFDITIVKSGHHD